MGSSRTHGSSRAPARPEKTGQWTGEHLRVLMLNGDIRGVASFWRCWHLGTELVRIGHKVTLLTVSATRRALPRTELSDGFTLIESPNLLDLVYGVGPGYGLLGLPYRMMKVSRRGFDLVHAFEHKPNVLLPAVFSRALNNCPLVADWADWWGLTSDGSGSQEGRHWPVPIFETALEEFMHRRAERVTTISAGLRDRALSLGIPASRVHHIPSGAPTEAIHPMDKGLCRRELGISPSPFLLGYVGSDDRDLDLLAPGLSAHRPGRPTIRLAIAGPKPPPAVAAADGVLPFGRLPFSRLEIFMGACDALVLPQRDNVFNRARWPNKFGDYLAAGRPILCSRVGDVARIVEEEGCGLTWRDTSEFLDGVDRLIEDAPGAERMGAAARRVAEGRLSWRNLALQFLSVYRSAGVPA